MEQTELVDHITSLPTADGGSVPVVVRRLRATRFLSACRKWINDVQVPYIDGDMTRADNDWDWLVEIPALTFAAGLRRRPKMFQICLAENGFPIGMVSLLETERWPEEYSLPAVFAWYLTGAPAAAVIPRGAPKLLMAAALDVAVTVSLNGRSEGRLWLHADPEGGEKLMDWYSDHGLERLPAGLRLPSAEPFFDRRNDGRYFRLTAESSANLSGNMDRFRS